MEEQVSLHTHEEQGRRFLTGYTSVQNLTPEIFFPNNELHIILKRRNLEICKHSIFCQLLKKNHH